MLEDFLKEVDPAKRGKEIEIKLVARLRKHLGNPKFTELGERLEKIKERHEQGFLSSLEFLKEILELAKEVVAAERDVDPVEERDASEIPTSPGPGPVRQSLRLHSARPWSDRS